MMKVYSNSKLSLYEQCPEAFRIKYIDRTFPELPRSMALFLGEMVHESLEWLYVEAKDEKKVELDDLIFHFADTWHKNFSANIKLNGLRAEDFMQKGIRFLMDYYFKHAPFAENTIEVEKRIVFPLNETYKVEGYVDRIVLGKEGEYEIHDYKTNERMKSQDEVDADRQLAFYHLGLKELFGADIKVKLIWHFLAHNQSIISQRSEIQLDDVKKNTVLLIKKIEETRVWPSCGNKWCDWCEFKKTQGLKVNNSLYGLGKGY